MMSQGQDLRVPIDKRHLVLQLVVMQGDTDWNRDLPGCSTGSSNDLVIDVLTLPRVENTTPSISDVNEVFFEVPKDVTNSGPGGR